ncbi:MAG: response regulator [Proteobacteria bacterium]|nr:response regulator [Pseudomonadota bacterium]
MPAYVWDADPLTFWRERILFILCFITAAFGIIPLIPSVILAYQEGLWSVVILDSVSYAIVIILLINRHWSMKTRGYIACLIFYGLGAGLLFILGPQGTGYIWLFGASVMISSIIGLDAAIWILLINTLTLISVSAYAYYGAPAWAPSLGVPLQKMTVLTINFLFFNTFVTITLGFMLNGLKGAIENEREISANLRKSEQAIRLHHERFLTVLNSIDASIYVADMETHDVLFMNRHIIERLGKDMTGSTCWQVFRNESGPCDRCMAGQITDDNGNLSGGRSWQEQHPVTRRWYVNHDRIIRWTDGRPAKIQIATDITEFKKLEAELQQAHKMEAIGTLAGGIAHDFNNILYAIIGYTELALDDVEKGSLLEANLKDVFTACKRAVDLVRQILAFARQSVENVKPIMTGPIVKEVLKLIRSLIPSTIDIRQNIASNSLIMGNSTQVHQIIMNLCTNAAHAMDKNGGILKVELTDIHIAEADLGSSGILQPGEYLKLSVSDTGSGIDPEILDFIFEPYFTTKRPGEGTGMGLAVVQGIVESYGGRITVESEKNKGSTFSIYLPVSIHQTEVVKTNAEMLPRGTERILFVDDELSLAKMGSQTLERLGYTVTVRASSLEALALFKSMPDDFDLVITDMTMPNMTGDKLATELMKVRRDIPIILCTGYSQAITDERAFELGIKAFCYKPVTKKDLAHTVRKVLGGSG